MDLNPYILSALLGLLGIMTGALIAVIGWFARRFTGQMDQVLTHLMVLNHRTEKLEARMTTQEDRPGYSGHFNVGDHA